MLVWAIVGSGLVSLFLWKKANPTKKPSEVMDERIASVDKPRASARP